MAEGWAEFPDILSKHPSVEIRHVQAAPLGTQNAEQLRMSLIDYNVKCNAVFDEDKRKNKNMHQRSIASECF